MLIFIGLVLSCFTILFFFAIFNNKSFIIVFACFLLNTLPILRYVSFDKLFYLKIVELKADKIITNRDFPVHSAEVLSRYFELFINGREIGLPPVPLINVEKFLRYF